MERVSVFTEECIPYSGFIQDILLGGGEELMVFRGGPLGKILLPLYF